MIESTKIRTCKIKNSRLFIGLLALLCINAKAFSASPQPNIIFVYFDDLGYGDLSCLNKESKISTPNFDKFAEEGLTLLDAHTPSAVCTPSRYGVLTGRYPWRSGLKSGVLGSFSPSLIRPGRRTIANLLGQNGYNTAIIGKWHLGLDWQVKDQGEAEYKEVYMKAYKENKNQKYADPGVDFKQKIVLGPNELGFDYSYICSASWDMSPIAFIEDGRVEGEVVTKKKHSKTGYANPQVKLEDALPVFADKVDSYIKKMAKEDKPFFLYYPSTAPHTPHVPNQKFIGKSDAGLYGDFVTECDWVLERLMSSLKESGIDENTLVIVSSDNGPENDMVINYAKYKHKGAGILRGRKRNNFEGGNRIPTFLRWPAKIEPSSVSSEPLSLVDIYATCADVIDVQLSEREAEDSYSFLPLLFGQPYTREAGVVMVNSGGRFAMRKGDWVYMHHKAENSPEGAPNEPKERDNSPVQLYNLSTDIEQKFNKASQYPGKTKELEETLGSYIKNGRSNPGIEVKNDPTYYGKKWKQAEWVY